MSNLLSKKKKEKKKKRTTRQWKETRSDKKRNLNTVEHSTEKIKEKKNEHFSKNTQGIDLKKRKKG